jgi:hypothetical protein
MAKKIGRRLLRQARWLMEDKDKKRKEEEEESKKISRKSLYEENPNEENIRGYKK